MTEKIPLKEQEFNRIFYDLNKLGFSREQIIEILSDDYISITNDNDLQVIFGKDNENQQIFEELSNGYSFEDLIQHGISSLQLQNFKSKLESMNLTVENALAINQYSNGSNMILSAKRGVSREQIKDGILSELTDKLQQRGLNEANISEIENFVQTMNYVEPLYKLFYSSNNFFEETSLPRSCKASVNMTIKHLYALKHIDSTLSSLDEGLSKTQLPTSMKLYRAVKCRPNLNLSQLSNNQGYTSTSPLYDKSFAKYDDYDVVMELYVPKGTQGIYITPFSDYDTTEQEVLLNANDIIYTGIEHGIVDQNGRIKDIIKGIVLSKDKSCYKKTNLSLDCKNKEDLYSQYGVETAQILFQEEENKTVDNIHATKI